MQDGHIIRRSSLRWREPCHAAPRVQGVQQALARGVTLREPLPGLAVDESRQCRSCHSATLCTDGLTRVAIFPETLLLVARLFSSAMSVRCTHLLVPVVSCKLATIITDTTDYIQLMCTNLHSLAAYARDQLYAHRDTANVRVREVNITLVLRK